MAPAPIITALGTKLTLRKVTESMWVGCHNQKFSFAICKDNNNNTENRVIRNFLKPFEINSRKIVNGSLKE